MPIVHSVADLREQVRGWRAAGERVALVPTMGALHAGHISLVELARRHAERVVASVFVNPRQFGAGEDFGRYPRTLPDDAAMLNAAGCDLLFAPDVEEVYPAGFATTVAVAGLGDRLEGAARPGHFDGVSTVVAKLLLMAGPDVALFGEKDWQQLAVVRRMAADLNLAVEIVGAPIVRDGDDLALSSRNRYLSADARARAAAFPAELRAAVAAIEGGENVPATLERCRAALLAAGFEAVDYVELCDADLRLLTQLEGQARLVAAARIEGVRLLDNMGLGGSGG